MQGYQRCLQNESTLQKCEKNQLTYYLVNASTSAQSDLSVRGTFGMTPEQSQPPTPLPSCTAEELRRRQVFYANLYEQQRKQREKDAVGERQSQMQATDEQHLTARERRALCQRRRREQATEEQRQAARERDTLRQKLRRQQASEEQRQADRQREAQNARRRRAEETDEQRRLRQEKNKLETRRRRRQEETDEERRAFQREIAAITQRLRRARQTDAQKEMIKERSRLEQRRRRQEADEEKKLQQRELNTLTQRLRRATDTADRAEIQRQIDAYKERRRVELASLQATGAQWTNQPTSSGHLWREESSSVVDEDSYGVESAGLDFKLEVVNFHRNNLPDAEASLTGRTFGLDQDVVQNMLEQEEFLRFQRTLFDTPVLEPVSLQPSINQDPQSQTLPLFFISSVNDEHEEKRPPPVLPDVPTPTPAVPREFSTEIADGYDLGFRLLVVNVHKLHEGNIERTMEWFRLFPIIIRNCWVAQEDSLRRQLQVLSTATAQLDPSSANATRLKLDFNDLAFKLLVISYYKANDKGDTTLTIDKFRLDENKILAWVAALATNIPNQENGVIGQAAPLSTNVLPTDFLATAQATAPSLVSGSETARQQIGAEGGEEKTNAKGPTAMA